MAINIYTEPAGADSPYRPYYFDCSSDEISVVSIIADIYVEGDLITTVDVEPILGQTNQFRIEVGDIMQKNLYPVLPEITSSPEIFEAPDSCKEYYIRAFEVLDNGTTLDTSWTENGGGTNYEQSSTLDVSDVIWQHDQKDIRDDYNMNSSVKLFGTNRPQLTNITRKQSFYLGGALPSGSFYIRQKEYTGINGTGTDTDTNSGTTAFTCKKMYSGIDGETLDPTTKSVSITLFDSGNTQRSEEFIVNLKDACEDNVVMYWYNHYGQWDSYAFKGRVRQRTRTKTKRFESRLTKDYNFSDRGEKDLTKDNERTFQVYSDTVNPNTIKWLAEIDESIDVRIEQVIDGTREIIPVNVTKVSSGIEDSEREVTQIMIDYMISNKRITHIG